MRIGRDFTVQQTPKIHYTRDKEEHPPQNCKNVSSRLISPWQLLSFPFGRPLTARFRDEPDQACEMYVGTNRQAALLHIDPHD
jgi:hypothetical protein